MISDFMVNFATSCDTSCMNQRNIQITSQLGNLTNTSIYMQPANTSNGQVQILKNGVYASYDYSLTTQVITNFSGTIVHTSSPTLTTIYWKTETTKYNFPFYIIISYSLLMFSLYFCTINEVICCLFAKQQMVLCLFVFYSIFR